MNEGQQKSEVRAGGHRHVGRREVRPDLGTCIYVLHLPAISRGLQTGSSLCIIRSPLHVRGPFYIAITLYMFRVGYPNKMSGLGVEFELVLYRTRVHPLFAIPKFGPDLNFGPVSFAW